MNKRFNFLYVVLLVFIYGVLFFLIRSKMLFTPDFGLSDIYHHGVALKFFFAEHIRQGIFPFWTDSLQGGFPLSSEWQLGGLYIINLVLLSLFSFSDAYNLLLIINFFLLSLGFFLLLKELKVSPLVSLLVSVSFAFNGAISLRQVHFSLIQTFSLCPLLFYVALKYVKTEKKIFAFCFPIILSQMIFAGFVQIVFMAIIGLLLFIFCYLRIEYKHNVSKWYYTFGLLTIMIVVGIVLVLPQILPSLEFGKLSPRNNLQLDYARVIGFPFQWKNIVNFVLPYAFGNPKYGTYPLYNSEWGIFWENTPYIGILFASISVVCFFLFMFKEKSRKKKFIIINLLIALLFFLLTLGKNTPLYVIFNFPPFNFFRTQSRFLLMVNVFIFLSFSLVVDFVYKQYGRIVKFAILFLLIANCIELLVFMHNYHLFIPVRTFLKIPRLAEKIDNRYAYFTLGQPQIWNDVFLKKGWGKKEDVEAYLFFKNFLHPNSNLFYNKKTFDIYAGGQFVLRRADYLKSLIVNGITVGQDHRVVVSKNTEQLLRFLDIRYLIFPWVTNQRNFKKIDQLSYNGNTIYLYEIGNFYRKPTIFYIPSEIKKIDSTTDFEDLLNINNDFTQRVVVEDPHIAQAYNTNQVNFQAVDTKFKEDFIEIKGVAEKEGLIVLKKNWYPNWELYIDGRKNTIYKTNLIHIGFIMPKGTHTVKLIYKNSVFYKNLIISIFVFFIYCFILMNLSYIISFINHKRRFRS